MRNVEPTYRLQFGKLQHWLPLVVLAALMTILHAIRSNSPEAPEKKRPPSVKLTVEVAQLTPQDFPIILPSYGRLYPKMESELSAETSGNIIYINPNFAVGGTVTAGEKLLSIDPRDLEAEVSIANAELAKANAAYTEEKARAEQAKKDWETLHPGKPAPALALRKPQLAIAAADIQAAQARLDKANLEVTKTDIFAPYTGIITARTVELGEQTSPNQAIGSLLNHQELEIRLPIHQHHLPLIDLSQEPLVAINSVNQFSASNTTPIYGTVVRYDPQIDPNTQQLYLIAEIDNQALATSPLLHGKYVDASIQGTTLTDAIVIPSSSIYQGRFVYTINAANDSLEQKAVETLWSYQGKTVIKKGLEPYDLLITTPLGKVIEGTPVTYAQINQEEKNPPPIPTIPLEVSSQ